MAHKVLSVVLEVIYIKHVIRWCALSLSHSHGALFVTLRLVPALTTTLHITVALMRSGFQPAE